MPRQRLPDPSRNFAGDLDGASAWNANSRTETGRFMGVRGSGRGTGNHGAITQAQLAETGLVAVETPGHVLGLVDAGLKHYSVRPATNHDPSVDLTQAEMEFE